MISWRERMAALLPRLTVVGHDLLMVWICWQALHHLRYAMLPTPIAYPLWSTEIAIVLLAQGLVEARKNRGFYVREVAPALEKTALGAIELVAPCSRMASVAKRT